MHDKNGTLLKKGDKVLIEAIITDLSPQDDYCNVSLETTAGRRPDRMPEKIYAINTGVLVLVDRLPDAPVLADSPEAQPTE